ncbi:MAG: ComEC family competence protein, partial [Clostridiales bacterium]|nr:ComEC family competence protein [Clostridiales bacterium]
MPSTPLIWFTAGFALVSLAGVLLGGAVWMAAVGLACVSIGFLLRGLGRWPQARRLLAGVGIALVWLVIYGAVFVSPAQAMENRTVQLDAVVTRWPERTDYGARVILQAGEGEGRKVPALLYGDSSLSDLRPGDKLSCVAYCTPADASRGEDSLYYASQGIHLSAKAYGDVTVTKAEGIPPRYALTILSGKIRQTIDRLYPEHEAGFLRAILTGDKSGLEQADKDNFNRVGLGHVVVISGLHVTFLMGVLTLFLDPRKKRSLLVLLPVLLAFCLMTGSGPGTVRAAILCTLALLAPLLGREYNCFTGLSTALLLLLAWNPWAAANAGLQFSFLSTLGILLFGENWCKAWLKPFSRKAKRWLRPVFGILTVSLAAMVFTVPLSWYYFGRFSLIAPLANLCASWAVSLAFVGGALSVLVGAVCFPVGHLLAGLVGLPIRYFFWFAGKASQISLAAVEMDRGYYAAWALFVYGLVLLYLLAPVKEKRPILPACACVVTLCLS